MKVQRINKYKNRRIKEVKKFINRAIIAVGLGTVVICGANIIRINAQTKASKVEKTATSVSDVITNEINSETNKTNEYFKVGSGGTNEVNDFLYGPCGQFVYKYSEMYGVDPNVIGAMAMQESSLNHKECIPGGYMYSGYGVGLLQLESPSGQKITAFNYVTGEYDTEYITMVNACDLEKNIKIGCMIFQNSINNNKGNILMAIQVHNYGQPMFDLILDNNCNNASEIKSDYVNLKWIDYVKEAHYSPWMYISNWQESEYGDGNYVSDVLRFCPSKVVKYKYNGKDYKFDLVNLQVIDSETKNTTKR